MTDAATARVSSQQCVRRTPPHWRVPRCSRPHTTLADACVGHGGARALRGAERSGPCANQRRFSLSCGILARV
eukprot:3784745-Rhodomonas_salina.3